MKNTNDFSKCKAGDKLFFLYSGKYETIYKTEEGGLEFKIDGDEYYFNFKGKNDFGIQVLFWSPIEIIAPEKSKEKIPFDLEKALSGEYDLVTREDIIITEWKWFQEFDNRNKLLVIINNDLKMMKENGRFYCDSIE